MSTRVCKTKGKLSFSRSAHGLHAIVFQNNYSIAQQSESQDTRSFSLQVRLAVDRFWVTISHSPLVT